MYGPRMSTTEAITLPLTLGQQFAAARHRTGLDQEPLGKLLGVNRTTISRWENDKQVPPFDAVAKLSEMSGWDVRLFARAISSADGPNDPGGVDSRRSGCNGAQVIDFRARQMVPAEQAA